jgi:adenine-specific DNA-methyltransferase
LQPIAVQISKLRFFISLVVDQKNNADAENNFGILPLPNLETKFVAANSLIGIEKPEAQNSLFDTQEVKTLEKKLKAVRHKLFSAKTPTTKLKYRKEDKRLRNLIAKELKNIGWSNNTANRLANWDPYDQNAKSIFFDPEWMFDIPNCFDIIIGNPPYVKENVDKSVFDGLRDSKYYQGKMDLWYFFACKSLDFLKTNGLLAFIATNNWVTNSGASKLRTKIIEDAKIRRFVDFSDFKIFESAGIQTMIMIIEKNENNEEYDISYSKLLNSNINYTDLQDFLLRKKSKDYLHFKSNFSRINFENTTFDFIPEYINNILNRIKANANFKILSKEVNSGIDIPQDSVNKSNKAILGSHFNVGDGIFVLTQLEFDNLNLLEKEKEITKPFYTTKELYKFNVSSENRFWIIYTDSSFKDARKMNGFPNLKKHLDRFQTVITSENKPYGLNRSRDEKFFKGERILVQRKCPIEPSFVYVNFDSYVNRTFIPIKTNRIDLKYLVGIYNSRLTKFWLRYKGKMQGDNFQVDKDPILSIPIKNSNKYILISIIVNCAIFSDKDKETFEDVINALVFNLYFPDHMVEKEIDVIEFVEQDIENVIENKDFDKLSKQEKKNVIEQLQKKWSHPDNEVHNRIKLFAVRSPEILKPILES